MTLSTTHVFIMPELTLPVLDVPLVVVCHDAGAANLVFAWLRAMHRWGADTCEWRLLLGGPALKLWNLSPITGAVVYTDKDAAFDSAKTLLSGTGWATRLEHDARCDATRLGLHSIAVIDHWVNYRARFERDGQLCLPDEIWVSDEFALGIAGRELPSVPSRQMPNYYLAESVAAIAPLVEQNELLYVLEPIRAEWAGSQQAGEFLALDFFVQHLALLGLEGKLPIRLRPHPSDPAGKYDAWIAAHPELAVSLDDSSTLANAISRASVVCGAETFAMVVALAAGRRVISTLPPKTHACRLPQKEIVHLRDLVSANIKGSA